MKNNYKTLILNTLIFAIGNVLVKLVSFILMPIYTSVLTTEQYGVSELLNSTIEIVLPIATLCIIEAFYRFSIDEDTDYQAAFMNSIYVILFGDLIITCACVAVKVVFDYEYAYSFLLLYIATTFYKLTTQFARGLGHVKRYAMYGVINALTLILSNIILLVGFNGGIKAYLTSFSIGYGVAGLFALILSKEYVYFAPRKYDSKLMRKMLEYSVPNIPNMLAWWVNSVSDRYIVILFWGTGIGGLYTAASKLPAIINLLSSIFQLSWQYSTAKEIESSGSKEFFSEVFRWYSYLCITACAGLLIFNKLLCRILLQSDFYVAWRYVPLLLLAAVLGCFSMYFGTFYNAIKNNKMLMVSTVVGAATNIVLNFLFIPRLGGIGAALTTVISYAVVVLIRVVDINKFVEIKYYHKQLLIQSVFLIVSVILSTYTEDWIFIILEIGCFIIIVCSDIMNLKNTCMMILNKMMSKTQMDTSKEEND